MWAEAYLEQARADWRMLQLIREYEAPDCHALHYLQMTCEKLGKAFLITGGTISPHQAKSSHVAFKRFLQVASRNHVLRNLLKMTSSQFKAHVNQLLPIAETIERLTPALAHDGPNVEYPWESPNRQIHIPATHTFLVAHELRRPPGVNLLKIIDLILQQFYRLFT